MARYIDAEKLKAQLQDFSKWCRDGRKQGVDFVLDCPLPNTPTADVQEVKHGRWVFATSYGSYMCSVCDAMDTDCDDYFRIHRVLDQEYCPYCGAMMDEEEKE